jgi:hypothetical protein
MDLLQVIIPDVSNFYILLKNGERIPIYRYSKIDINFCERTVFKNGASQKVQSPLITYKIELDKDSKEKLKTLFSNYSCSSTLHTRRAKIKVGKYGYIFDVDISARPDMGDSYLLKRGYRESIEISLKLENTDISLFDDAEEAYEKYSRFEILDL